MSQADGLPEDAIPLGHDTFYTRVERDYQWIGIREWHREGEMFEAGFIPFTGRSMPDWWRSDAPTWEVISEDPLTLAPSLACGQCGHHGFIRDGKWVPA